jgi:hypothetical protein
MTSSTAVDLEQLDRIPPCEALEDTPLQAGQTVDREERGCTAIFMLNTAIHSSRPLRCDLATASELLEPLPSLVEVHVQHVFEREIEVAKLVPPEEFEEVVP